MVQRCHLYKKSVVFVPAQIPGSVSMICPREAIPFNCGMRNGLIKPIIPLIELVVTDTDETVLVAFTIALTELPASSYVILYVLDVAEFMFEHTLVGLHRCQMYVSVGAGYPVQVPFSMVKSSPSLLKPEIDAILVFTGAVGFTIGPNKELNFIVPPKLLTPVT